MFCLNPHSLLITTLITTLLKLPCTNAKLSTTYYQKTCPRLQEIIQTTVTGKQITSPTTVAGTLRLFFHDCFSNGCDASILVSSNSFNKAERDADINLSLAGDAFDVIVRAKSALEVECPGVVSCADILVLATRDLLTMLGGPFFTVRLGRKDSVVSKAGDVENSIPKASMSMSQIIKLFASRGFTVQEMVALTGAHTVGFSHCKEFASRLYPSCRNSSCSPDSSLNPEFADALRKSCKNYRKRPTIVAFNDVVTPNKFDNIYYQNLPRGLGLLATDQALLSDPRTKPFVELYARNQTAFFKDFVRAMEKLSVHGVKIGRKGEVRRRCHAFNDLNAS